MKNLSKADVYDVAIDLIEDNGSTTTLDIKNELRNRGFFAKQADVSEFMLQVADEEGWNFSYNGVHRVYTMDDGSMSNQLKNAGKSANAPAGGSNIFNVYNNQTATDSYTKRDGTIIEAIDEDDAEAGDYRVFSVSDSRELYFKGGWSRSEVRFAFAKITDTDYADTRIKTIK